MFVPDGAGYTVKINAYATGSFDFKVKELIDGQVQGSIVYSDVPIDSSSLKANFQFTDINNQNQLNVDRNGVGLVDAGYLSDGSWVPYNVTIQSTIDDLNRVYILGWTNGVVKNSFVSLLKAMLPTETATKSKGKQADGVLGTAFLNQLNTEYNKGSINEKAFKLIKQDISWLLGH